MVHLTEECQQKRTERETLLAQLAKEAIIDELGLLGDDDSVDVGDQLLEKDVAAR
jgi:hypothetical protein